MDPVTPPVPTVNPTIEPTLTPTSPVSPSSPASSASIQLSNTPAPSNTVASVSAQQLLQPTLEDVTPTQSNLNTPKPSSPVLPADLPVAPALPFREAVASTSEIAAPQPGTHPYGFSGSSSQPSSSSESLASGSTLNEDTGVSSAIDYAGKKGKKTIAGLFKK